VINVAPKRHAGRIPDNASGAWNWTSLLERARSKIVSNSSVWTMFQESDMQALYVRAFRSSLFGTLIMTAILFLPAGTPHYWQAWVFLGVFVSASGAVTVYLAIL